MQKITRNRRWALLLLAGFAFAGAQAEVYKWVDSNGVTHYDEQAPQNGKSSAVTLHPGAQAPRDTPPSTGQDNAARERAFRQRQLQREQAEARDKSVQARNNAQCQYMQGRLNDMNSHGRMYGYNAKGERDYLSDQQRAQTIARYQQEYDQHCR